MPMFTWELTLTRLGFLPHLNYFSVSRLLRKSMVFLAFWFIWVTLAYTPTMDILAFWNTLT